MHLPRDHQPAPTERFQHLERIGRGGMGDVFRAWDAEFEEHVALKSLRPDAVADPRLLGLFKQEIKLARRIKHVNVARVYDLVEVRDRKCLSMEYIDGRTLSDVVRTEGRLPLERALNVVGQVCLGIQAAHDVGVVHRDLKPQNIMITRSVGRAMILDFGVACHAPGSQGADATIVPVAGSPPYMSPEQLRCEPATERSDLYSIGVLFQELLTGQSPFATDDVTLPHLLSLRENPLDPRAARPDLPEWAVQAIARCLAMDQERRFTSVAALWLFLDANATTLEPTETRESPAPSGTAAAELPLSRDSNPHALVVGPPDETQSAMVDRLRRLGCVVNEHDSGAQALGTFVAQPPSLLVVAGAPVDMDAITFLQCLQSGGQQCPPSLAVVSGADAPETVVLRQLGVADFVSRPLNVHAFARTVRRLLTS